MFVDDLRAGAPCLLVHNYPVARWSAMFEVMGSTKRIMHSYTYMRSAANLVCRIAVQQASMQCRGKTRSERLRSDVLISQGLLRSIIVGYHPHWCIQNDDAVWAGIYLGRYLRN